MRLFELYSLLCTLAGSVIIGVLAWRIHPVAGIVGLVVGIPVGAIVGPLLAAAVFFVGTLFSKTGPRGLDAFRSRPKPTREGPGRNPPRP
ncbi:hypothetical protein [Myxococcus landrumensis]|uniref:Uncharacterized protein n=1 Tax=Myxococcus landrumensis TaxID=2813577 RepID=A0ABX7NBA2_9BACT|nr:hypothetical protein [Myxococcus landrumus]QSQ13598.1 hypothetical protein JY572_35555 [Myxococcus landrumus]